MTKLQRLRQRAVALLLKKADINTPMLIDYQIDAFLRNAFKLPQAPSGQVPYEGWMVDNPPKDKQKMKTSNKGVALVKKWEGCRLKAYQCSAHVWTIGYGHTQGVKPGNTMTRTEAEELLKIDLLYYERAVSRNVEVALNQNQFDALVSFVYNVGEGQFKLSTLLKLLNQAKYKQAANQFFRWNRAGGKKLEGLSSRRREEYALFTS